MAAPETPTAADNAADLAADLARADGPLSVVADYLRQAAPGAHGAALVLLDPSDRCYQLTGHDGLTDAEQTVIRSAIDEGIIDWAIEQDRPQVFPSLSNGAPLGLLCLPLVGAGGPAGALVAPVDGPAGDLDAAAVARLDRARRVAAPAFVAAAMSDRWRTVRAQLEAVSGAARALASIAGLAENLKRVVGLARTAAQATVAALYLPNDHETALDCRAAEGPFSPPGRCALGSGIAGWVAHRRAPILLTDYPRDVRIRDRAGDPPDLRSAVAAPIQFGAGVPGVLMLANLADGREFDERDLAVLMALADQAAGAIERARLYDSLQASYLATLYALANAIEARDPYTGGHSERVTQMALMAAEQLGWPDDQRQRTQEGGILHDVGKIAIPDAILRKPDRLTEQEFAIIRSHPAVGARMLTGIPHLAGALPYVLRHQERYDGTGYPDGLAGADIPIEGRLLAIADTIDAITSNRPYRQGAPVSKAMDVVKREAGRQFDPDIAAAYLAVHEAGRIEAYLQTAVGRHMGPAELLQSVPAV